MNEKVISEAVQKYSYEQIIFILVCVGVFFLIKYIIGLFKEKDFLYFLRHKKKDNSEILEYIKKQDFIINNLSALIVDSNDQIRKVADKNCEKCTERTNYIMIEDFAITNILNYFTYKIAYKIMITVKKAELNYSFQLEHSIRDIINEFRGEINAEILKRKINSEKIQNFNYAVNQFLESVLEIIKIEIAKNGRIPSDVKLENIYTDICHLNNKLKVIIFS